MNQHELIRIVKELVTISEATGRGLNPCEVAAKIAAAQREEAAQIAESLGAVEAAAAIRSN